MPTDETVDDFLAHYGIKGMRWGVKKGIGNPRLARTNKENKVRSNRKDAKRRRQVLSDKDLDGLVKRLEQEKKLKTLLDEDLAPGRTVTKRILGNAGTKVAGVVLAGAGVWAVKTALEGGFSKSNLLNDLGKIDKGALVDLAKGAAANVPKLKK